MCGEVSVSVKGQWFIVNVSISNLFLFKSSLSLCESGTDRHPGHIEASWLLPEISGDLLLHTWHNDIRRKLGFFGTISKEDLSQRKEKHSIEILEFPFW